MHLALALESCNKCVMTDEVKESASDVLAKQDNSNFKRQRVVTSEEACAADQPGTSEDPSLYEKVLTIPRVTLHESCGALKAYRHR